MKFYRYYVIVTYSNGESRYTILNTNNILDAFNEYEETYIEHNEQKCLYDSVENLDILAEDEYNYFGEYNLDNFKTQYKPYVDALFLQDINDL